MMKEDVVRTIQDGKDRPTSAGEMISVDGVSKTFRTGGNRFQALDDVSFEVRPGEMTVVIGPSGCGKSTLLRIIAGLERPDSGRVTIGGTEVRQVMPEIGVIFQELHLFPWLTVRRNVEFGLVSQGVPAEERTRTASELLSLVGLDGFHDAYITQLSGGMRQRVALARSLATNPRYLLLDEPFGALDEQTRMDLQEWLVRVREMTHKSMFLITHSIGEAVFLGNHIIVMAARPGRVMANIRVDLPYPRDRYVPEFADVVAEVGSLVRRKPNDAPRAEQIGLDNIASLPRASQPKKLTPSILARR